MTLELYNKIKLEQKLQGQTNSHSVDSDKQKDKVANTGGLKEKE